MEHFYKDIYGFSGVDLFALYKKMVDRFDSGSHFVEVGAFLGRSAVFMAVEIIKSGKNIILLGGSVAWGFGASSNKFIPSCSTPQMSIKKMSNSSTTDLSPLLSKLMVIMDI